jgi:tetratricopeptide (TPR) repeat protein
MPEKSLQEILEARQQSSFVGRRSERLDFEANLKLSPEDPQRRFIFAISGQGGMGKTTLISQYRALVSSAGYVSGWSDEDDGDLVEVMSRLSEEMNESGAFDGLRERIDEYRQARHKMESDPDAPEHLARIVAGAAGRGGTKLARRLPVAGVAFDFIDEEAAGETLGDVAAFVVQRAKHRKEAELLLEPVEMLTPQFVAGLRRVAETQPVALFFDTFEETAHVVEPWLQRLLRGQYGSLPSEFLCSIAGRYALGSDVWGPYESLIRQIELEPLSAEETEEFLRKKGVTDEETVAEIIRLSHCLPILLVSMTIGPAEAIRSDTAVDLVLRSVPDELRSVALDAAVPRTLDRDAAGAAFGGEAADGAFEWLIEMPFVLNASEGWKYHAVIREEFLGHSARESATELAALHERMAEFHKEHGEAAFSNEKIEDGLRHGLERSYHRVAAGAKNAVKGLNQVCIAMWQLSPEVARSWAVALRDGERDHVGGAATGWGEAWIEATDEFQRGHEQPTIELFDRLLTIGDLAEKARVKALAIRSDLYFDQDRYDVALTDIDAAIELDDADPRLHHERAWIHYRCGREEEAFEDAEEALILAGEEERRAPRHCDMYLSSASDLFDAADVLDLAEAMQDTGEETWALVARGRMLRELTSYEEAIEAFERIGKAAERMPHIANEELGKTYAQMGAHVKAAKEFREALESNPECVTCWRGLEEAIGETLEEGDVEAELLAACRESEGPGVGGCRAVALLGAGFSDSGLEELERAIEENPLRADFRLWLARALCNQQQADRAIEPIEEALKLRPEWPQALALRGICRYNQDDFAGADEDWSRTERMSPSETSVVNDCDWGLSLSIIGRYEDAIDHFDREMATDPTPELAYNRAVARAGLVGPDTAAAEIADAREAVENAERDLVKHYGLGGLMALVGEAEAACTELERACECKGGDTARSWAKNDPAWNSVRTSARFKEIVA